MPRLVSDVIEYCGFNATDNETNRRLRQRAHGLHKNLDLSSLKRLSLESLQLDSHGANAETLARTSSVIAVTNYVLILAATIILIDRLIRFLEMKYCVMTGEVLWSDKQLFTEESALTHFLRANYAWWKAPSPAFAHNKHTHMMWSAAFEAIDGLDNRGTWEEVTSGPISLGCQVFYNQTALFSQSRECCHFLVGCYLTQSYLMGVLGRGLAKPHVRSPQDSITSRPWMRTLFQALSGAS